MIDDLSIGKKMTLLSGVLLCLLLVVLLVGLHSLDTSTKSGLLVAEGNELSAEIAQLEIDHLNWAGKVSSFLSDDRVNILDVQMDHNLCAFGKWYNGEGRKQAEQMVPALRSALQAIAEPHARLHGSAQKIKAAYRAADAHLPQFLTEKELDHLHWAFKIQEAIIARKHGIDIQFDDKKCAFGQFLFGSDGEKVAADNPAMAQLFATIKPLHQQLHEQGKIIDGFLVKGEYDRAENWFSLKTAPLLDELSQLLKKCEHEASAALAGQQQAKKIFIGETQPNLMEVQRQFSIIRDNVAVYVAALKVDCAKAIKTEKMVAIGVGIVALLLGVLLAWLITRSLAGPMRNTVEMLAEIEKGRLGNRLNLKRKDGIGQMANSMDSLADCLQHEVLGSLQKLAAGDLTFEVKPIDGQDALRGTIQKLGVDLNEIMAQILVAGNEISTASGEVADSSQTLSQGATEQAASLEEISATLNESTAQIQLNAENAAQASSLTVASKQAAEQGRDQMQSMVTAMTEIDEAGQNISKIIKTIDEIAFQTNLLALNAAVEAARAGQHGKGFAVVAEEVRNLAARSAKAAAETAELIEGSVTKTKNGSVIAGETEQSLLTILEGIGKVTDIVAEISSASKEQAVGIAEINEGVSQMDTVNQQNTAISEESAAAAEEMSGQAAQLNEMLHRFTLKGGGMRPMLAQPQAAPSVSAPRNSAPAQVGWDSMASAAPASSETRIALDDSEFGKY